jgi:hypothetical protein
MAIPRPDSRPSGDYVHHDPVACIIGLEPAPARSTAMGQLAMHLPPAILARLTGITLARAAVWHAATSASQARNLPDGPER